MSRGRDRRSTMPLTALQESWFAEDLAGEGDSPSTTEELAAGGPQVEREQRERAFLRLYRTFLGARAIVAAALLLSQAVAWESLSVQRQPAVGMLAVCVVYMLLTWTAWSMRRFNVPAVHWTDRWSQWAMTIGIDLLVFFSLHLLSPVAGINYVPLFALPVLMAAVLAPAMGALAVAALVALLLLGEAAYGLMLTGRGVLAMTQAGLIGGGFFVMAVMVSQLARRLASEETVARGSQLVARQQALVNRIVIEAMDDGVVVVNHRLKVRAANPAARRLLGAMPHGPKPLTHLRMRQAWAPLGYIAEMAFERQAATAFGHLQSGTASGYYTDDRAVSGLTAAPAGRTASDRAGPDERHEITLDIGPNDQRQLLVRTRLTPPRRNGGTDDETLCVLFMQDLRDVESRIRQEKLAAMGRISAGVAHEIRNPLSAIAQANALLAEDATSDTTRKLTHMVADNVERLNRIVNDIMAVAPSRGAGEIAVLDVEPVVLEMVHDWARTAGVDAAPGGLLQLRLDPGLPAIRFDEDHLRRVLVNLLDNGRRYCKGDPGALQLRVSVVDAQRVEICVANDGVPVAQDVRPNLFEPFFSTRSRGTGLGLYICRELCERHQSSIDYHLLDEGVRHRNEFRVLTRIWHGTPPHVDLDLGRS